jgi:hypothetical protein
MLRSAARLADIEPFHVVELLTPAVLNSNSAIPKGERYAINAGAQSAEWADESIFLKL